MDDFVLKNYIKPLETKDYEIIGVYRQGSDILGYSDEYSDIDYSGYGRKSTQTKKLAKIFLATSTLKSIM